MVKLIGGIIIAASLISPRGGGCFAFILGMILVIVG
jgi:hypothetical protein